MALLILCAGCSGKLLSVPGDWRWRDIPHTSYEIASPPDWRKDPDFTSDLCLDGPPQALGMILAGNGRNGGITFDKWIAGVHALLTTSNSNIIAQSVHETGGHPASGLQRTTFEAVISEGGVTNRTTVSGIDIDGTNWIVVTTQVPSTGISHNGKAIMEQIVNSIRIKKTPNKPNGR